VKSVNVEALGYMTGSQLGLGNYADTKFQVTQNMNAYDARIFGAEFAYQRDFGFITPDEGGKDVFVLSVEELYNSSCHVVNRVVNKITGT
jgi:hypothetical protein